MTDSAKPFDPHQQALDIERLKGGQRELQREIKSSVDGMRHALDSVQIDVRSMSNKMNDFTTLQLAHDGNNQAILEMKTSLGSLSHKLESWFDEFQAAQMGKWEKHELDRDKWRAAHELDNRQTRETLIRWSGVGFAIVLVGGAVVTGFLWSLDKSFRQQTDSTSANTAEIKENRDRIDKLKDKQHEMELYLVRSGRTPQQPGGMK